MIIYIYSNASYISELKARSRSGGYLFLGPKYKTLIQKMSPKNGPVHVECRIVINVMVSATEAELGGLFENCQKATSMRTAIAEMGHQQPPTLVATDDTAANSIVNGTIKQKRSRAIDMRFYWVRDRIRKYHFYIFWEEVRKNLADYVTKHHPIWHHRSMRPRYVKAAKIYIENSKDRRNGTRRGCAGTTNPRGTRKSDNPLKGIRNPIPQDLDNPLKVIRDLVKNGTQS